MTDDNLRDKRLGDVAIILPAKTQNELNISMDMNKHKLLIYVASHSEFNTMEHLS
jgi:hypothetical protein